VESCEEVGKKIRDSIMEAHSALMNHWITVWKNICMYDCQKVIQESQNVNEKIF
jgi:hypothetical protein